MGIYGKYIFPRLMDWGLGSTECSSHRRSVLARAKGSVLEIGFGTGLNLSHYPDAVRALTAIDSERLLPERARKRADAVGFPVEMMLLDASRTLPFGDCSFDFVVSTWTLCSIENAREALSEVKRVLKPDGEFIFLEHGRSDDPRLARLQDLLNPLQRMVGRGCNLNRRIDRCIITSGFEIVEVERFVMPRTPRILGEMYRGVARPA